MSPGFWIVVTGTLVAGSCGLIGCFLVLRKMAMLGDAISHAVLLGIVAAFLVTHDLGIVPMFLGAVVSGLLTAFVVQLLAVGGAQEDAAIGVTFTALFALGVVLLSLYAGEVHLDTHHVLFGETAFVPWDTWEWRGYFLGPRAVWIQGAVLALNLLVIGSLFKEFKLCAFDPAMAASLGIPVLFLHYLQMALVSVTAVAAFESVGAVLAVAMLIAPGATAYLLTDRLERMLWISLLIGGLSAAGGYQVAATLDASVAGSMTVVAGACFLLALLVSPRHGVLARMIRRRRLQASLEMH